MNISYKWLKEYIGTALTPEELSAALTSIGLETGGIERVESVRGGLRGIGWNVPDSEGTMFVWAPLPEGYTNSEQFCVELMERSGVICVPGSSFGSLGEGYVRFALVLPVDELEKAVQSIKESGIIREQ